MPIRKSGVKRLLVASAIVSALMLAGATLPRAQGPAPEAHSKQTSDVFTPAHPTVIAALRDFLDFHSSHPAQPIAFTHTVHLAKKIPCEACHAGTDQGPEAVIPSVKFCMTCHSVIDVDNPEIKKVAAYQARGEDIPWVRVYDYSPSSHVRFNHAPHIRAQVACESCHGDLTKQTTAQRAVDLDMGHCLTCHKQNKAPTDCTTCHF